MSQVARIFVSIAAVSGATAIAFGTYGAHGFKPKDEHFRTSFETAARYHLIHSVALLSAPFWRQPYLTGSLFTVGILLFSGSCYVSAIYEDRSLSKLAPVGGVSLMLGWLSLIF